MISGCKSRRVCIAAVLGIEAFTASCRPHFSQSKPVITDLALFREVVLAIKVQVGPDSVAIDPRPLIADPRVLSAGNGTRARISASQLDARREVLRQMGISATADDGAFANCPGAMEPQPPPQGIDLRKTACPHRRFYVVDVALPRSGGAYYPTGGINESEIGKAKGYFAVRALLKLLGPEGASMTAYDFVMVRDSSGTRWKLVKPEAVFFVE